MDTIRDQRGFKFGKLPTQILYNPGISSNAKVVYAVFDKHSDNETMVSFPGQKRIAVDLGVSQGTVARAVAELVQVRAVSVEKKVSRKGWRNIYTLLPLGGVIHG